MTFEKLSKKQKTVFRWAYRPEAYALICDGSVRSGKTAAMACSFIHWAMSRFDGERFAICGNTVKSAERNIIIYRRGELHEVRGHPSGGKPV